MYSKMRPVSVLLLRQPVSMEVGTDAYHDAFGSFCLPSFSLSAIASDNSASSNEKSSGIEALASRHERDSRVESLHIPSYHSLRNQNYLMTHHLAPIEEYEEREYCIVSFPILTHASVHVTELTQRILRTIEGKDSYDGVVITSQRAVQAWGEACRRVVSWFRNRDDTAQAPTRWMQIPFYVVGPTTGRQLRQCKVPPALCASNIRGEECGSGEVLARLIAADLRERSTPARLLYLVGDKRSPILLDTLRAENVSVDMDELRVYETRKDPQFVAHCRQLSKDLPQHIWGGSSDRRAEFESKNTPHVFSTSSGADDAHEVDTEPVPQSASSGPDWIVFFSPSGGNYALPDLRDQRWIATAEDPPTKTRIACIGTTTAAWVREKLGFEPHAIAAHPMPGSLREAISQAHSSA